MIEKGEWPIARERREPQRESGQLHRHGIAVHAEQAPLRNRPPEAAAIQLREVVSGARAITDERRLIRAREVSTRRDKECRAAHRGIEHAQLQNVLGGRAVDQWIQRPSHHELCDGSWRVEGPGRLPLAAALPKVDGRSRTVLECRFVVQHGLIHSPELLDTEVAVINALSAGGSALGRGQGEKCPLHRLFRQRSRRVDCRQRGEEPPVERRDPKVPGNAALAGEPGNRLQRLPQPSRPWRSRYRHPERFDRVAVAIDRMPDRHQPARLGKEQKEHAVDRRQRALKGRRQRIARNRSRGARCARYGDQTPKQLGQRIQHPLLQRSAHTGCMDRRKLDELLEERSAR